MKATIRLLSAALCALALSAAAAAENAYTLGLRVGNGQRENHLLHLFNVQKRKQSGEKCLT